MRRSRHLMWLWCSIPNVFFYNPNSHPNGFYWGVINAHGHSPQPTACKFLSQILLLRKIFYYARGIEPGQAISTTIALEAFDAWSSLFWFVTWMVMIGVHVRAMIKSEVKYLGQVPSPLPPSDEAGIVLRRRNWKVAAKKWFAKSCRWVWYEIFFVQKFKIVSTSYAQVR